MSSRTPLFVAVVLALTLLIPAVPVNAQKTAANLWIDANGGTCSRQSSPGAYVDAQACASMQAAQTAAQAGDTVIIKNGTYGRQSLSSGQKTSAVSYFAETSGQVLLTGTLSVGIDHVHITGIISAGGHNTRNSLDIEDPTSTQWTDVLVDGFHGSSLFVSASGVTIQNSEFGDADACTQGSTEDATRLWSGPFGNPTSFKFLHNVVHDWTESTPQCNGMHVDGFQLYAGASNVVFDGNTFYNNATSNIMTEGVSGAWLIQNNYFGRPVESGNNLVIGRGACSGVIIQNNIIDWFTANNEVSCSSGSPTIRSNIFPIAVTSCNVVGGTFDHNIFVPSGGITCGSSAKRCTPAWLNGAPSSSNNYDVRLSSSDTCAKDAGDPAGYPATDFYGTTRAQGAAPDAGPFEVLAGAAASGSAPTAPTGLAAVVQ
jgi:hypothetical protein